MENYHEILTSCPLFEGIALQDLTAMQGCIGGKQIQVSKGQYISREGEPATHVGLVLSGAVRLEREDYYGNRSIVAHIGPGALFGETYACADVVSLPISIVADDLSRQPERPGVLYLSEDGYAEGFSIQRALSRNRLIHAMGQVVFVAQSGLGKGGTWDDTVKNLKNGWSTVV